MGHAFNKQDIADSRKNTADDTPDDRGRDIAAEFIRQKEKAECSDHTDGADKQSA